MFAPRPGKDGRTRRLSLQAAMATAMVVLALPAIAAEEDKDLDLIPQAAQQAAPAAPQPAQGDGTKRNYLEDAFSYTPQRGALAIPFPSPAPSRWEDRLFFDARDEWRLRDDLALKSSDRFNLRAANDLAFPSHENVVNELRELYLSWHPEAATWLDFGRVNLRSGAAIGYNPTDFFRSRAVVEPLTADPTVLREDRLGTVMLRAQHVWQEGSISFAYAPQLTRPTAIYNHIDLPSFDPMLDRTNSQHRILVKISPELHGAVSTEALVYHAGNRTQLGANFTAPVGQQTVLYLEWAGGMGRSLVADALAYGRDTGSLPARAPAPLAVDNASQFENQIAAGFSYVPANTRLTLNFEYHYNQAGFSGRDWKNWFAAGRRLGAVPGVDPTLWYIRSYALDQQQQLSRHAAFIRADWVDAFVPDLEITALTSLSLQDGSGLVQVTADYTLSQTWMAGALASFTFGGRRSEFGSLPQSGAMLLRLVHYLH